jgi:hypothetical protein
MHFGSGNTAIMKNGRLKKVVYVRFGPAASFCNFRRNVRYPLAVMDMRDAHKVQRIRQGLDGFMKIQFKSGHCISKYALLLV